ncbi:carbohydrate porin [Candidatus Binatus soli]|jgi:high affinity Mn2+ porin|uniref:carbohydrate porin n=1 Tax=Candidatus Binatus soli TaxID=1953413 RepID=UPI003D14D3B3
MPNQSPIERPGLAGRASEVRKPGALLPIRLTGASAATGLAMLICVLLAPAVQLRAQTGTGDSSKPEDEYHLGYDAGYQAGLRAAKEKLVTEGGATGTSGNQPATTPEDSSAPPATDAGSSNAASRIKSLWDDMVNHGADNQDTVFHHSQTSPFWLSAQANFIAQLHPRFHAQYSGPNSLDHAEEQSVSRVVTVYTGFQFDDSTELVLDAESSGWSGLSQGLGLAGFVDLDVVRNPQLSAEPYLARIWLHKVIRLSDENVEGERTPLSLLTTLPARRIDIHVGKVSLPDFFDLNSVGSDSHLQFMNWTVDNNGAWDYAADTRGYTYAIVLEYYDHDFAARFAEALEPTVANGINLEWNLQNAHAENYELEYDLHLIPGKFGAIRVLGFTNYANMGDYHFAIDQFENQKNRTLTVPNIEEHPGTQALKYGVGLNFEQQLNEQVRVFMRAGWNEGQHESWAYTEVDQTALFGWDVRGDWWHRPNDKWGVAFVVNGISRRHRQYLALGGLGFLLGDGNLSYGPEEIMETYYNFPITRGLFGAFDVQYINNPGYNRARGPVIVPGLRLHIEL